MADRLILAGSAPGEVRVALVEHGRLADYQLWRPGSPDGLGDAHLGRIIARVPALGGAFVALAGGIEGFLPDSGGARHAGQGDWVSVRVIRAAMSGKGPRLAVCEAPVGRPTGSAGGPALLAAGADPLRSLARLYPDAAIEVDDDALIPGLRAEFGSRLRRVASAFTPPQEDELAGLAEPMAHLPGGALLHIQPTRALVAIDIDSGSATARPGAKSAVQSALNQDLLPELARQIRLRNLSGAIVVDLAGMAARRRAALAPALQAALAQDPLQPRLLGFTALGFAEISRPRLRPALHELLATPLAAGLSALRAVAMRPERAYRLRAAPAVVAALEADRVGLAELARRRVHGLMLSSDPALPALTWVIEETP